MQVLHSVICYLIIYVFTSESINLDHVQVPSENLGTSDPEEEISIKSFQEKYVKADIEKGKEKTFISKKKLGVPVINFDMNTKNHFELLLSLIHLFKGKDLPYHSKLPPHLHDLLAAARQNGSEVYVNKGNLYSDSRYKILFERMKSYDIKLGKHDNPDITVFLSVYANLKTFKIAAEHQWRNNSKLLLIVHRYKLYAKPEDITQYKDYLEPYLNGTSFNDFIDFNTWDNTLGLMPKLSRYVMPTFFPYKKHCGTSLNHSTDWVPTFCEHGSSGRRDFTRFARMLGAVPDHCSYKVQLAGIDNIPHQLEDYAEKVKAYNLDDIDDLDFFCQCDYLLPLLSPDTSPDDFQTKLSSTAARAVGYDVPVIAWTKFKETYPMCPGLYYENDDNFLQIFLAAAHCL